MSTTIDNLCIDHRGTMLRDFTDAAGITMRAGEGGILRQLSFDQLRLEIHRGIEREGGRVALLFSLKASEARSSQGGGWISLKGIGVAVVTLPVILLLEAFGFKLNYQRNFDTVLLIGVCALLVYFVWAGFE